VDFSKIDIRVGNLVEVYAHPDSDKIYCEKIDIGEP
jgi:tRNA-binding EMAP/Myf-like protein